jgi:hypothetical protein
MAKTGVNIKRYVASVLALCATLGVVVGSCTYDYFEDETNFRLYVPQIESGEISKFYVAFHRIDGGGGTHVVTREFTAPFNDNESIRQGILKFKLPPGQYDISTFADYSDGVMSVGQDLASSTKGATRYDQGRAGADVFTMNNTQPRALFLRDTQVFPLGNPATINAVTADIDDECRFKAKVSCTFSNMPAFIASAVVSYNGVATRFDFDGVFRRYSPTDVVRIDNPMVRANPTDDVVITSYIYPSVDVSHQPGDATRVDNGEAVELDIDFFDADGAGVGSASFRTSDLATLDPGSLPQRNGVTITDKLVIYPRDEVNFRFREWLVVGIDLVGWGDINEGPIDMH